MAERKKFSATSSMRTRLRFDEGAQGRVRDGEVADIGDPHAAPDSGEFGEEVGPGWRSVWGAGFRGPRTATRSRRRASRSSATASRRSHFFLTMPSRERLVGLGGGAEGGGLGAGSVFQVVENGVLAVLVFG